MQFIDGAWRHGKGQCVRIVSPSDDLPFGEIAYATPQDVDDAVRAAARAFPAWSDTKPVMRSAYLLQIADHLESRRTELAARIAQNNGKPLVQGETDLDDAVACYRYYAELILHGIAETVPGLPTGLQASKQRLPLGPVALIVPWNFPLTTAAWKVAPALAAGCTVILKVSEIAPFAELALGTAANAAGLPAGVLNILVGAPDSGESLTRHPLIAKISFTGSNAVGQRVMAAAAHNAIPVTLELGGKSPIVVFDDVDPDWAAGQVFNAIFYNSGQVCSAMSRLVVSASIADAIHDRLQALAQAACIGDPNQAGTNLGPVTSRAQFDKIVSYLEIARAEGLQLLTGGTALERDGYFLPPTIYRDVPAESRLWREEIFGPVLVTRVFHSEQEAIALANDTDFGLGAMVLSRDVARAGRVANAIRAGNVWINGPQNVFPQGSWGGFGASGFGRELGPAGLDAFTSIRQIVSAEL